ncbi:MAG: hypothetical protein OIF55_16740 [Amphritea sp.]|nr:hypothetical protein [Amphritea sp.]
MRYIVTHKVHRKLLGEITLSKRDFEKAVSRAKATWPDHPIHVKEAR